MKISKYSTSLKGTLIFSHFPFRGLRGKSGCNQLIAFLDWTHE